MVWRSADSTGSPERRIVVPDPVRSEIVVEFEGSVIRGRVIDSAGSPVPRARVREIQGPLHALAAEDGTFTLVAVAHGVHRLQASDAGRMSRGVEFIVEPGRETPEIVLEIGDAEADLLTIQVIGREGVTIPGAFVFVELTGGSMRTLMTNESGDAVLSLVDGMPEVARLAAHAGNAWAFGTFKRPADGVTGPYRTAVRFVETGSLQILSRSTEGMPVILSPSAPGDLGWMLARLGAFPSVRSNEPLLVRGLPPGTYQVIVGANSVVASVTRGSTTAADLP